MKKEEKNDACNFLLCPFLFLYVMFVSGNSLFAMDNQDIKILFYFFLILP